MPVILQCHSTLPRLLSLLLSAKLALLSRGYPAMRIDARAMERKDHESLTYQMMEAQHGPSVSRENWNSPSQGPVCCQVQSRSPLAMVGINSGTGLASWETDGLLPWVILGASVAEMRLQELHGRGAEA